MKQLYYAVIFIMRGTLRKQILGNGKKYIYQRILLLQRLMRVLGVGDRWDDREAVRSTFENKCCVKTVKFMNAPEVRNLVYELMAMGHMMDGLIRDCNNYDIVLCH